MFVMCRNGKGVEQLGLRPLVVYKQSYVHRLYGETNILIVHALMALACQNTFIIYQEILSWESR